ncbi:metallophosphoesterase family protein [Jiangella endophytica]|uniref:metallophosphoesterase family protein n=1 Tax=Jiangella endophytica TaxID=1623398 RepID=UPI000E357479|nr:metallophosphoesterase [Jiangella endophytica]
MGFRILHLSDTHVTASGFDEYGVNTISALERILHDARHVQDIDLVLVTGDVADDGSVEGCLGVRERVGAFAERRAVPHVYTTGNHDDRTAFAEVFGSGHLDHRGDQYADAKINGPECAAVSMRDGVRIVTLDSLIPGQTHGRLSTAQLEWLAGLLAEPAPAGTVIALHHPPVHVSTSAFVVAAGLHDAAQLGAIIAGTDVMAVLCGHYHLQLSGNLAGIPVWVTPGVVTRIDLTAPGHLVRGVKGASATVVDLGGPFSPAFHLLHARDPQAGQEVYLVDTSDLPWIRRD